MDGWHATRLVDHVVNLAGKVVLLVGVVMVAGGLVAGATGEPGWFGLAGVVSLLVAGGMLWTDTAPAPVEADELEER